MQVLLGDAHFRPNPGRSWPGRSCQCVITARRSALGIIGPRPPGVCAPVRAGSSHGAAQCFVSWQRRLGTWRRSRWRLRRPWRRPTLHPRCRRQRAAEVRPRAETCTGCVPSWLEVGVRRRRDPGGGLERPGRPQVRASSRGDNRGLLPQRPAGRLSQPLPPDLIPPLAPGYMPNRAPVPSG